jgi:hypothetical protein
MTQARYGLAGRRIRDNYDALAKFAQAINDGTQRLDGTVLRRAELYARAARATYHETERRELAARGYDEEASILGVADHCATCVSEDALGFRPLCCLDFRLDMFHRARLRFANPQDRESVRRNHHISEAVTFLCRCEVGLSIVVHRSHALMVQSVILDYQPMMLKVCI